MNTPAFAIHGLKKHYRTDWLRRRAALRGVDLSLERGGFLGLVGPNGSGKSTLLRILAGIDQQSSGELTVLGASPLDGSVRRRVGWSPEDSPFPPELDARACARLIGSLQGRSDRLFREEIDERLEEVGLGETRRVPLGRYSRGMLRRFGLAQAFLGEPELVLLDEPTAGLDAEGFEVLDHVLERAREAGTAVVISTHLLSDLEDYCDELAVLASGRLVCRGTTAELFRPEELEAVVRDLDPERSVELETWLREHGARLELRAHARGLGSLYRRGAKSAAKRAE